MVQQKQRCGWCVGDPLYEAYHDKEWGVPIYDDLKLFEFLILETFQAGLSWITILRKRENFRIAFDAFDYKKVAQYDADKFDTLIINKGIIRNKLKIKEKFDKNITAKSNKNYFIDCSDLKLIDIISVIKDCEFFVGNNSGPLNLASALGVKSFGLIAINIY